MRDLNRYRLMCSNINSRKRSRINCGLGRSLGASTRVNISGGVFERWHQHSNISFLFLIRSLVIFNIALLRSRISILASEKDDKHFAYSPANLNKHLTIVHQIRIRMLIESDERYIWHAWLQHFGEYAILAMSICILLVALGIPVSTLASLTNSIKHFFLFGCTKDVFSRACIHDWFTSFISGTSRFTWGAFRWTRDTLQTE